MFSHLLKLLFTRQGKWSYLLFKFILSHFLWSVDLSSFVFDAVLLIININVDDIIFMETLCPSLWNSIFNFFFHLFSIWTFSQSIINTLFMQFIKLVIKLSNHMLNLQSLLFLQQSINNCLLNLFKIVVPLISCIFHSISNGLLL